MRWLIGFALLRLTAADVAHRRRAADRPALTGSSDAGRGRAHREWAAGGAVAAGWWAGGR